jgi:hypothetical protein
MRSSGAARLAAEQLCLEESRQRGIRVRLARAQGVTGLVETAGDDVLACLDPGIAVGNPIEQGPSSPCARHTALQGSHRPVSRRLRTTECRISRYELVEQERLLGLAGIERQPGTLAQRCEKRLRLTVLTRSRSWLPHALRR